MSKVKKLMMSIPGKLGIPEDASKRVSKAFELLFDYDALSKGPEFKRIGDTMEECETRLDTVFSMIDGAVYKYSGDKDAAKEAKKLLLLCSTPDVAAQMTINTKYSTPGSIYSDIMSTDDATNTGARGWWNG